MKIKLLNWLLIIDILTVLLILAVLVIPSSPVRIVLGLPFLLFFPGYTLVEALFARKEGMDGIERIALSFGMSIACTALIGLGLNYTPWGIRLEPVLYSISAFIIILSAVALFRRRHLGETQLIAEYRLSLPGWEGSAFNKSLTVILVIAIVGAIGVLGYTVAKPKVGEKFTEFYILGQNGKAEQYPVEFDLSNNQVTTIKYGNGAQTVTGQYGEVTLGIVNQEQVKTVYRVVVEVDGKEVTINTTNNTNATNTTNITNISLEQGEKWEQKIGFAPLHTGDNQKVEFFLYKDGAADPEDSLHLWVDVVGG